MRSMLKVGMLALMLTAMPIAAQAGSWEGVAIGAGTGLVIAGPPGAVVGALIGAVVDGPDIVRQPRDRRCWTDRYGDRQCSWRSSR